MNKAKDKNSPPATPSTKGEDKREKLIDPVRAEQARNIKTSIVAELRYRELKSRLKTL